MSTKSAATVNFTQRSETRAWVKSALRFEALLEGLRAAADDRGNSAPAAGRRGHDVERGTSAIAV